MINIITFIQVGQKKSKLSCIVMVSGKIYSLKVVFQNYVEFEMDICF